MNKYEYWWSIIKNDYIKTAFIKDAKSVEELYFMSKTELMQVAHFSEKSAEYIMEKSSSVDIEREYDIYLKSSVKAVCFYDELYPRKLTYYEDKPFALFYFGNLPSEEKHQVAIIGARECSEYGRFMASKISEELSLYDVEIISGMAVGIDGIAQMSALDSGARSYAVLGSGVDVCYPRANKVLYERLKENGGIISEYPPGTSAVSSHFPKRNRIISGLSDVVIVVEAREKSGTFITVDYALEQGKEIMIVPGRATDPLSVGCNALIKAGAYPVQKGEDVIELLGELGTYIQTDKTAACDNRVKKNGKTDGYKDKGICFESDEEKVIFEAIDFYPIGIEQLIERSGYGLAKVQNVLMKLELNGYIKEVSKGMYVNSGTLLLS